MRQNHKSSDGHSGGSGDDDSGNAFGINLDSLGLGRSINGFINLVDAILARPPNSDAAAAGRNAATDESSKLFWIYTPDRGLQVRATSGYLSTKTGNGGFTLAVRPDGSWALAFDGSAKVIGHEAGGTQVPPPAPATGLNVIPVPKSNLDVASGADGSKLPPSLINGGLGWDTFQGGVGDYMIGGSGTAGGGLAGKGNCALYTSSPGSILMDMQNGFGYGGNAEGNVVVNMNQVRGSLFSNVLIGNANGSDLKSGGDDSLLISTGGTGFEMRPDGSGNVLVSTAGGDRVVFEPGHGWLLGDDNIMLGFNSAQGSSLDLRSVMGGASIAVLNGPSVKSNFHTTNATGYSSVTGTGDINDYVKIVDAADGSHVFFNPTGQVRSAGIEVLDLKFTHGLNVNSLYANHQILA